MTKPKLTRQVNWLWKASKGYRLKIFIYTAIGIGNSFLSVQSILAIKNVVDVATSAIEGSLAVSIAVALGLLLARLTVTAGLSMLNMRIVSPLANHIRCIVMTDLFNSEYQQTQRFSGGDVITRCNNDAGSATLLISVWIPQFIVNAIKLVLYVISMFLLDASMAVAALCILPVSASLTYFFSKKIHRYNLRFQQASSADAAFIQESLDNILTVQSFNLKDQMIHKMHGIQSKIRAAQVKQKDISAASEFISSLGYNAGYFLALLVGVLQLAKKAISFGTMTAFLQMLSQIETLITTLLNSVTTIISSSAQVERLIEMCSLQKENTDPGIRLEGNLSVSLSNLSFAYQSGKPVFLNANCRIEAGKITAVTGPTGSGKSTLIRLLLSFLDPSGGSLELHSDCSPPQALSQQTRCNFAYVPQGNTLFDDTIRNNVKIANENAADEQIEAALRHAKADFVFDLPDGLDTPLSKHCNQFSPGQLQRIAIARALLSGRRILLLDEATSALDHRAESGILQNIREHYPDRTCVLVTHNKRLAEQCDEILVVKNRGLHRQLRPDLQYTTAEEAVHKP